LNADISQGSVATCLRCGGACKFTGKSVDERILKSGQYFANLRARVWWYPLRLTLQFWYRCTCRHAPFLGSCADTVFNMFSLVVFVCSSLVKIVDCIHYSLDFREKSLYI